MDKFPHNVFIFLEEGGMLSRQKTAVIPCWALNSYLSQKGILQAGNSMCMAGGSLVAPYTWGSRSGLVGWEEEVWGKANGED